MPLLARPQPGQGRDHQIIRGDDLPEITHLLEVFDSLVGIGKQHPTQIKNLFAAEGGATNRLFIVVDPGQLLEVELIDGDFVAAVEPLHERIDGALLVFDGAEARTAAIAVMHTGVIVIFAIGALQLLELVFGCYEIQPMVEMDTYRAESALDDQACVHVLLALLKIHGDAFFRGQRKVGLASGLVGLDLVEGRLGLVDGGVPIAGAQADARILAFAFQPHAEVPEFTALLDDRVVKNDGLIISKMLFLQAHTTPHVQVLLLDANTTVGSRIALA